MGDSCDPLLLWTIHCRNDVCVCCSESFASGSLQPILKPVSMPDTATIRPKFWILKGSFRSVSNMYVACGQTSAHDQCSSSRASATCLLVSSIGVIIRTCAQSQCGWNRGENKPHTHASCQPRRPWRRCSTHGLGCGRTTLPASLAAFTHHNRRQRRRTVPQTFASFDSE